MKNKIIKIVEKRLEVLYADSLSLLRSDKSYIVDTVDKHNLNLYLLFLESALLKPYNRLCSLATFIDDPGQLMTDQMYPFSFLSDDAKKSIQEKSLEATNLGRCLDAGGFSPNFTILWKEELSKR